MKTINASEFKAKCLGLLDEVAETGEILVVLKRGRPVARVVPAPATEAEYPQHELAGTVTVLGDIVSPALPEDAWEALREGPAEWVAEGPEDDEA